MDDDKRKDERREKEDELIDAGSELSFPASDPPSYMGGSAVAGPPPKDRSREGVSTELEDEEGAASEGAGERPSGDGAAREEP